MKKALLAIALIIAASLEAREPQAGSHKFVVRMSEGWATLHPTAGPLNISNCLFVLPDGRVHLELRRQEFLEQGGAHQTLAEYEFALTEKEMGILRGLLDAPSVQKLDLYVQPILPLPSDEWGGFSAEISRQSRLQKVGYFVWKGEEPRNSEVDKAAWRDANIALKPLVDWFRGAKTFKSPRWRQVRNVDGVCGE